ncbi:MAG: helix-turn-helix domain-containing protein [Bacteroidetes bacterium]|nr:helix-turn-helix domain-containing protein [Bacteroidota bacterium]
METQQNIQQKMTEFNRRVTRIEELFLELSKPRLTWLEPEEIARLLNVGKRSIDNYRDAGLIPYSKLGGKVYYRICDIEDYLTENMKRKPADL